MNIPKSISDICDKSYVLEKTIWVEFNKKEQPLEYRIEAWKDKDGKYHAVAYVEKPGQGTYSDIGT